jgi:hypothetical protein
MAAGLRCLFQKLLHYQYLKNEIKVLSDIQQVCVGMWQCVVALLIAVCGANELFSVRFLWLYKETHDF